MSMLGDIFISTVNGTPDSLGSMATSWHTSDRTVAVKSLSLLCLIVGNPPDEQFMACSTLNLWPQTHLDGRPTGNQP